MSQNGQLCVGLLCPSNVALIVAVPTFCDNGISGNFCDIRILTGDHGFVSIQLFAVCVKPVTAAVVLSPVLMVLLPRESFHFRLYLCKSPCPCRIGHTYLCMAVCRSTCITGTIFR